ncbi:MAG: hypothetical protein P1R58_10935 [bacterium]|nr:hypothetical protein [bacterium]
METVKEDELTVEEQTHPFETKMLKRVELDFADAESFLKDVQPWMKEMHDFYHNAQRFTSLKKENKFPDTTIQEDVDGFVADARNKLFYARRPATVVGRERTDKVDAEAKQSMMEYQDDVDQMFKKLGIFLRDGALYREMCAQVDYDEKTKRKWIQVPVEAPVLDNMGQMLRDESGQPVMRPDFDEMGQPKMRWELQDVPVYKGAVTKRLDPQNVYFCADKCEMNDEYPIMVKSRLTMDYLKKEEFFINIDKLDDTHQSDSVDGDPVKEKTSGTGENRIEGTSRKKAYDHLEWQGRVDRKDLYEYLQEVGRLVMESELQPGQKYEGMELAQAEAMKLAEVAPGEKVWAICGVIARRVVVQLREEPFDWNGPNIIVGTMQSEEEGLMGLGLGQKIEAVQRVRENLYGMLITSFKQSVNADWFINMMAVVGDQNVELNRGGKTIEVNTDPRTVAYRIDPPSVAKDIYAMLEIMKQAGQNQGGRQDILTGRGDAGTQTLGESNMVMNQANVIMRDYLQSVEETFVRPLYELRNHINATLIDKEYAYRVVGKQAEGWRTITPEQIRADVDFICESSARETNRIVMIQQMMQAIQMAPLAMSAGQVVRIDRMLADLQESGFSQSHDKVLSYFPLLRLEEEQGLDIDQMLLTNALMGIAANGIVPPGGQGSQGGQGGPESLSEGDAVNSNMRRAEPQNARSIVR